MTLIVETGTGLVNAEAYISTADADTYFAARNNAAWAALDTPAKEAALRLGADYLGAEYATRWTGFRISSSQALDWPRECFVPQLSTISQIVDFVGVPQAVIRANAELAVRSLSGPLMGDEGAQVTHEQVGPISVTYANGARQNTYFAFVDTLLSPWLRSGGVAWAVRA